LPQALQNDVLAYNNATKHNPLSCLYDGANSVARTVDKNIMRCVIWKNNLDNRKQITGFSSVAYVKLYQLKYQLLLLLHY